MGKLFCLSFLFILGSASSSFSSDAIVLDDDMRLKNIGLNLMYLEDPNLKLSIEQLLSDSTQFIFKHHTQKSPNFSSTSSAFWLNFDTIRTANQMTSRILDVNAIAAKKINLSLEKVNLAELMKQVLEYFSLATLKKKETLSFESDSGRHDSLVDKNYVIQIFENIISNAIKYSEPGTEIKINVLNRNNYVVIEIIDQGPGISEDDQEKLFMQFQKLSAAPNAGESSIGLGLSIVKKYIEAMNGSIACESQLGIGTKFILSFVSM